MLSTSLLLALALTPDADAANVPKIKNVRIRQVVDSNNTFTYRSVVQGSVSDDGTVADVIASIDGVDYVLTASNATAHASTSLEIGRAHV